MQTASIQWIGEQKFLATSPSGHAVPFDSDRQSNKAPGAMEMVLMALGACTATDMVLILEKSVRNWSRSKSSAPANAPPSRPPSGPSSKSCSACAARSMKPP